jgi:hypothetical protein
VELRQLNSLCLIVECGSLKEAAKRRFLTPSAISLQIKELEQELGLKIFELKGRKLSLTLQGEILYCEVKKSWMPFIKQPRRQENKRTILMGKYLWPRLLLAVLLSAMFRTVSWRLRTNLRKNLGSQEGPLNIFIQQ